MPLAASSNVRSFWAGNKGLIVPVLMAMSILVIVVPLPAVLLDLLLSANITISVVILLTTLYVRRPLEFSVFPSLLLGTTLARLVLNVASTRLILTRGASDGTGAAGGVIQAFGEFVAAGNLTVGLIIFSILIVIQFLVITKGATRISEVAARFALDGMPGRQMAIDADLQAGLLTAEAARQRREDVAQQADFYGAMDGAGKFVRGDALASVVITLINIVGGIYIGMVDQDMPLREACLVFTKLTIGDGLVTQVPAFLISLAAGLLVTRTSVESDLSDDILGQMFIRPEALGVAAVFLAALSFTGLPRIPLLVLGGGLTGLAFMLTKQRKTATVDTTEEPQSLPASKPAPKPEDSLLVDPMELELGFGLIRLADASTGGDLLDRVTRVRQRIAQELGLILPKVRIRDNIRLDPRQYQIKIHDIPVAWGTLFVDGLLAIDTGAAAGELPGMAVTEPGQGRPAVWIEANQRDRAEAQGYFVVEPAAAVVSHLTEIVRRHCDELLSRQQVHQLLDNLRKHSPKAVEELIPDVLKPHQVHQVLCNLLRERVPIRNLETILETLGEYADRTRDLGLLTEFVRHALSRTICQQYRNKDRVLRVLTLDPAIESTLSAGISYGDRGLTISIPPQLSEAVTRGIEWELPQLTAQGAPAVLLTAPQIRAAVRQITAARLPQLAVLSLHEITRDTQLVSAGQVGLESVNFNRQEAASLAAA
ncbi:MAG: flagellar biosynthesis protein FlhA [Planctomycetes bacterium]|nr:flagellar biosynthesis protein FlhA [Planctomycetota bacterium]